MNRLEVGKITNTHGLKGEVKFIPWTNSPEDFESIKNVYLLDNTKLTVKSIKYQKNNLILKLGGIDSIEAAEKLKGCVVTAERSELAEIEDGEYYIADLIGLQVYEDTGEVLGIISDVFNTGANDIYEVKRDGKKPLLLPVIDSVVKEIDVEKGRVTVHLLEGLLDL